jgi:acetyl coenzyme A synthetase (ADP forming)-like protein
MTGVAISQSEQSVDIALRDGSTVHVRPIVAEDRDALRAFLGSLSEDSLYYRGCGHVSVDWLTGWAMEVDYADRYGLVVVSGLSQAIVAHAAYARVDEKRAEVAFEVADVLHGHGIATLLLGQLAGVAAQHGITELIASVMPENRKMLDVFRYSGFAPIERVADRMVEISLPTSMSADALLAFERREHTAALGAVHSFLRPHSVAIIGASERQGSVGAALMRNIVRDGYTGDIYPVNSKGGEIGGRRCFTSITDVPARVDLAVIAIPAAVVVAVARDCARVGVRALLVISAGFAEVGEEGRTRQQQLLEVCREGGMRLVGPNCLGVLNTDPAVSLNVTFTNNAPPAGRIGMMSQSGGVAIALTEAAARLGIGVSSFVSVGNKADISGNDLLEYWEEDPNSELIALYLESFGNPRRFARLARRVSARKPILAVKSGRTAAGSRAASSHTAALLSASDTTVDALFRQAGVIRAETLGELLDTASLLSTQPLPRGARVAIVTNGGGPGIMCADECQAAGLEVVEFPAELRERLTGLVPPHAAVGNPVDMTASASAEQYRAVVEALAAVDACDAVIALFVPALETEAQDVATQLDLVAATASQLTLAAVFMGAEPVQIAAAATADERRVARYMLPEEAVRALGHAVDYTRWRAHPQGEVVEHPDVRTEEGLSIIAGALARSEEWLGVQDTFALLNAYGIPCVRTQVVRSAEEAVSFAGDDQIALKAVAPGLLHKSDAGGVRLHLRGADVIRGAADGIREAVAASGFELDGWVVQQMAPAGVELLVGVVHDPSFGPVVACGAGGTAAELLQDIAIRITPLTDVDAHEMLRSLRSFPLLDGYRGQPRCDTAAVEDLLTRLSTMVHAHPEIRELDLNPVIVTPSGALVSDARIKVQPRTPEPPLGALRA